MRTATINRLALTLVVGVVLASFSGCSDSMSGNPVNTTAGRADSTAGVGGVAGSGDAPNAAGAGDEPQAGAPPELNGKCLPASGEPLPQRSSILSQKVIPTTREVLLSDVFQLFSTQCKGCHVEAALGGFQVTAQNYLVTLKNPEILRRLQADDLSIAMPSPPVPYSQRPEGDSVRNLVKLLKGWGDAGNPPGSFREKLPASEGQSPYALSTEQGLAFTNIGTCVPESNFPFASDRATMQALDAAFAARVAKADAPLLEDRIGLPLDLADTDLTSFDSETLATQGIVAFAPAYPLWTDDAGKLRYVRVPLGKSIKFDAKTQQFDIPDNTRFYKTFMKQVTDINGEKRWRKLETRLIVARHDTGSPRDISNYKPAALYGSYKWDETETHATLLTGTFRNGDPFADELFEYVEDEPRAEKARATKPANLPDYLHYLKVNKHWAIPSSQRCVHCHEGSLNDNFILGFTPLQANRRPLGQGGVYEAPGKDELNQLQRLIDLGVITGMDSPAQVVKLEDSQLEGSARDRKPRNDAELKAQAYMLANCAHCHNQNGFPSVTNKELADLLNFYPGKRASEAYLGGIFQFPLERFSPRIHRTGADPNIAYITPSLHDIEGLEPGPGSRHTIKYFADADGDPNTAGGRIFKNAPWRSLIYRNVQTPFPYSDADVFYPHMPFDSAGHDCRASQWLGEWMVSIPAVRKHPELTESCVEAECEDADPQPYREVLPGEAGFDAAAGAARARLTTFRNDPQYQMCPPNDDIVDAELDGKIAEIVPRDKTKDGVPDHANWVVTDLTERKGLWEPRRDDWKKILIDHQSSSTDPEIIELLSSMKRSDLAQLAAEKFPLALWKSKPGCSLAGQRQVKNFAPEKKPLWFDIAGAAPEAPVFEVHPGQAVFDMICSNCHGSNADSLGRQADSVQTFTGGSARVANFRFGLFNPGLFDNAYDDPNLGLQTNRQRVFGPFADGEVSADDWAARYLAWMALGGTAVKIPQVILDQVGLAPDAGVLRPASLGRGSANMLQAAQGACHAVLGENLTFDARRRLPEERNNPLIFKNGDRELWQRVCSVGNGRMLRMLDFGSTASMNIAPYPVMACDTQGLPSGCYPADWPLGNHLGQIELGLQDDNLSPWCVRPGTHSSEQTADFAARYAVEGVPLPVCPPSLLANLTPTEQRNLMISAWEKRGAINAGFLVFDFLDKFIKGDIRHIQYDQCELLSAQQ